MLLFSKGEWMNHDQDFICCDQSMNRPGFALLRWHAADSSVTVERMSHVDNSKNKNKSPKDRKGHGQILGEIAKELRSYQEPNPNAILLREEAQAMVSRSAKTLQTLHKVVGVADQYAWGFGQRTFAELNPRTIKTVLTGDPNAEKDVVAAALVPYVGPLEYACDDESDAVAVGIACLINAKLIQKKNREE